MNVDPVPSPVTQSLEDLETKLDDPKVQEAAAKVKKYLGLLRRFRGGALSFREYKELGQGARAEYRKLHGQPHSPDEERQFKKKQRHRNLRNKMAKRSRAANRRTGK